jgi:hypothetical protein
MGTTPHRRHILRLHSVTSIYKLKCTPINVWRRLTMFDSGHVVLMSFVFIFAYWCPTRFHVVEDLLTLLEHICFLVGFMLLYHTEHCCGHVWHRYSDDVNLAAKDHCFSSLHISSNPLTRTRSYEPNEVAIKNGHGYSISLKKYFIEQMYPEYSVWKRNPLYLIRGR